MGAKRGDNDGAARRSGRARVKIAIDCRKISDFGIGTYIRGLVRALAKLDETTRWVALGPESIRPLLPERFELQRVDAGHYTIHELFVMGRAVDRTGADLFHAPHYVVPFTRIPTVVTIHDLIHLHQPQRNPLARPYARRMLARAVRRGRRIFTVTETVARELREELGATEEQLVVTPNGIDDRFRAGAASDGSRAFLYVGNDKPHKDAGTLLRAFAIARASDPDLRLILAGGSFDRFAGEPGVERRGFVSDDDLAALYRDALAVIVPSLEEGFGLPAAEAMASGAPVITSDAPALAEISGDAALHFRRGDERELAVAMLRVASDRELRRDFASRGIAQAAQFTWRRCAERTMAAYTDALHVKNRRA
jgi:glycosyltransferase involved in cell wall biosynthesis